MSTKSKLLAMTENLQLPESPAASVTEILTGSPASVAGDASETTHHGAHKFPPVSTGSGPKTGPGQMLQFRGQMLAVEGELGKLRDRLKEHEGSLPTRRLDPQKVIPSRWANRHPDSFATAEFVRLKQDIELAGGNVQPISVRTIHDQPGLYEIVFGHRRHRACAELGIPVLATIDTAPLSDHELFTAMDRENRERADLSAYEQGRMYRRALDEKLYPSNRRLAEALGVSHTWVANVLLVADLPSPIVDCFRTPLEIQPRHAKCIVAALETDRKGVLRRAEKLRAQQRPAAAAAVVNALVVVPSGEADRVQKVLTIDGRQIGVWSRDKAGRLTVQIEAQYVSEDQESLLIQAIESALKQ